MALPVKDSFVDLERHRVRLEENVAKLQKALRHWQTWDAEYEGLKEEILAYSGDPKAEDIISIGRDLGNTLVTEKEIRDLLGDGVKARRNASRLVDVLSKRIDYVERNVKTLEKQLHVAEEKLNSILVVTRPGIRDEEGLPTMEIREELDDEGNIISSSARAPSDATPQMLEALRKAGVTDLKPATPRASGDTKQGQSSGNQPSSKASQGCDAKLPISAATSAIPSQPPAGATNGGKATRIPIPSADAGNSNASPTGKKMVTFTPETKGEEQPRRHTSNGSRNPSSQPSVSELRRDTETGRFVEIFDSDDELQTPIAPVDESPEDAALRREMLEYSMPEVGAVVAELTLDEGSSDISDGDGDDWDEEEEEEEEEEEDDDDDDDEDMETSSVDEEEDTYGRTTMRVIDDDIRKKMEEMEKKLNARMIHNAGPKGNDYLLDEIRKDLRSLRVIKTDQAPSSADKDEKRSEKEPRKKSGKKSVRFSEELDISPAPAKTLSKFKSSRILAGKKPNSSFLNAKTPESTEASAKLEPLKEGIFERKAPVAGANLSPLVADGAREGTAASCPTTSPEEELRAVPEGPPSKTLADGIVERPINNTKAAPPDPDGLDPALLRQEVAMEYHRMRNRMIQRGGGFKPREEELERVPLSIEEGGTGKKVSRFKAARLGKSVGL